MYHVIYTYDFAYEILKECLFSGAPTPPKYPRRKRNRFIMGIVKNLSSLGGIPRQQGWSFKAHAPPDYDRSRRPCRCRGKPGSDNCPKSNFYCKSGSFFIKSQWLRPHNRGEFERSHAKLQVCEDWRPPALKTKKENIIINSAHGFRHPYLNRFFSQSAFCQ